MGAEIARPSSTLLGAAGEHYVMSERLRRDMIAALAPQGAPDFDIIVTDRLCGIQVTARSVRRGDDLRAKRPIACPARLRISCGAEPGAA